MSSRAWRDNTAIAVVCLLGVGCRGEAATGESTKPALQVDTADTASTLPTATAVSTDASECPAAPGVSAMRAAELRRRAVEQPCSLGSLSLGRPENGALLNAVRLPDGPHWVVAYPSNAWGTAETVNSLERALAKAYAGLPDDAAKTYIGDLSAPWGGPLPPHTSHQSGRDADIGYPRVDGDTRWWAGASAATLDAGRAWALVRALVTESDVEVIFIDRSLQRLLRQRAAGSGEASDWLDGLFEPGREGRPTIIRHEPEHLNHLHVRFYNPVAQRTARLVHDILATGIEPGPTVVVPPRRLPPTGP